MIVSSEVYEHIRLRHSHDRSMLCQAKWKLNEAPAYRYVATAVYREVIVPSR